MHPLDPKLQPFADSFAALQWATIILDAEWRLAWVSDELKEFIRATNESDLGFGLHIAETLLKDTWRSAMSEASPGGIVRDLGGYLLADLDARGRDPRDILPDELASLLQDVQASEVPRVIRTSLEAVDPSDPDLPPYRVNVCAIRLAEPGDDFGWALIFFIAVRPNLLTLLARGDETMYERMARLVDPGPREAAVLFCDLQRSAVLARTMSTPAYFKLVRKLWTAIDALVADQRGIVGKHAGDGASAFFLVDDLGSRTAAASAAIRTARRIHELSEEVFSEVLEEACQMRVGLHWGANLYMGQLVPGGRLDVTALGDEVNETSRIEQCARAHESLASKQLVERLAPEEAADLGLDVEKLKYELVAQRATATEKAVVDAGTLAVTAV
jgi:class 3 adenylate cyclase